MRHNGWAHCFIGYSWARCYVYVGTDDLPGFFISHNAHTVKHVLNSFQSIVVLFSMTLSSHNFSVPIIFTESIKNLSPPSPVPRMACRSLLTILGLTGSEGLRKLCIMALTFTSSTSNNVLLMHYCYMRATQCSTFHQWGRYLAPDTTVCIAYNVLHRLRQLLLVVSGLNER